MVLGEVQSPPDNKVDSEDNFGDTGNNIQNVTTSKNFDHLQGLYCRKLKYPSYEMARIVETI